MFRHLPLRPVPDQEWFKEYFVASSAGEMWQELNMVEQEGEQEGEQTEEQTKENAAAQDHLLALALCFNVASIVFFL